MTSRQLFAIASCIIINTLDGFDVLVLAFAAASIAAEWNLSPTELGLLFSSSLLGMALGSMTIAPLADRYGRKPITILCLIIITCGMILSALAQSTPQLALMRFLTGLGVGGMLASLNTLVAEYSPLHLRSLMVSLLQSGYPIGAAVGGLVSVVLIGEYGWRSLFWFGGSVSLLMLPFAIRYLPESAEYLFSRGDETALAKGNIERRKLGMPELDALPAAQAGPTSSMLKVIWGDLRTQTLLLWFCYFMLMLVWYFVASWTPKLLVDTGLNIRQGMSGGVILSIGAVTGGVLLGIMSVRLNVFVLARNYALLAVGALFAFALLAEGLGSMMLLAGFMGLAIAGTMVGLYSCAPHIYPASARNTGLGWAIGFGRGGAVVGPYLAGELLARQFSPDSIYMAFSLPMLLAFCALWLLVRKQATASPRPG
ncbi:MAG: MFS transporter [Gammaproteobacteria bacterium]